jgi:AcrR family transcriptional regulator
MAAQAGTSESGIFRLFPEKYDVLMAVYDDCWREVNAAIDEKLRNEYKDPRERILDILRVVWALYEQRPKLMSFIIINTGNTDTLLVAKKERAIITEENIRYVDRIDLLCRECSDAKLLPQNVTARAAREAILGMSEGVLLGWYLADKCAAGRYPDKITIEEALAAAATIIGAGTATEQKKEKTKHKSLAASR